MAAKIRIIDGQKFTWRNGKGSTFASDLGITKYPDSFYIMSHRTGEQRLFLRGDDIRSQDADNEFQAATYFIPAGGVTVTIFNT